MPKIGMVDSNELLPIAMGVGLAVLTGSGAAAGGRHARWHDSRFALAMLMVGLPLVGAALYILGFSIERDGQKLAPGDAKVENWLLYGLLLLVGTTAARASWRGFSQSQDGPPWEVGHLDRAERTSTALQAIAGTLVWGLLMAAAVMLVGETHAHWTILAVSALVGLDLAVALVIMRAASGGRPFSGPPGRARGHQLALLRALDGVAGCWEAIEVRAIAPTEPALALKATIWSSAHGLFWQPRDAYALARYHDWAANHATVPTPALHAQRVTVWAGDRPRDRRGLRITPVSSTRWWRRDAWRSHRAHAPALPPEVARIERTADLLAISEQQLHQAGLRIEWAKDRRAGAHTAVDGHTARSAAPPRPDRLAAGAPAGSRRARP